MIETTTGMTNLEPIRSRKAILWGKDGLLAHAIYLFLEDSKSWSVVRVQDDHGIESLIHEVKQVEPDVVILCQDRFDPNSILPLQLLGEQDNLKVLAVDLESNLTQVYSKQNFILQRISDLLSIVETGNFPNHTLDEEVE